MQALDINGYPLQAGDECQFVGNYFPSYFNKICVIEKILLGFHIQCMVNKSITAETRKKIDEWDEKYKKLKEQQKDDTLISQLIGSKPNVYEEETKKMGTCPEIKIKVLNITANCSDIAIISPGMDGFSLPGAPFALKKL